MQLKLRREKPLIAPVGYHCKVAGDACRPA